jgi:SlyX protein
MTNDTGKNADRLTILEEKLEYQDYTMEKLNDVIITQQRQLDKLEGEMLSLRKKFDVVYTDTEAKRQSSS